MTKKTDIMQAAVRLFASQGFDGTTTLQISQEAKVTEPLIYYHFDGKEDLFAEVLKDVHSRYCSELDGLPTQTSNRFEMIENMINLHFKFVKEMPDETYLALSACPAKMRDPDHVCTRNYQDQEKRLEAYFSSCIKDGINSGEFRDLPVESTVQLLIAFVNGIVQRRGLKLEQSARLRETTIEFCRFALKK